MFANLEPIRLADDDKSCYSLSGIYKLLSRPFSKPIPYHEYSLLKNENGVDAILSPCLRSNHKLQKVIHNVAHFEIYSKGSSEITTSAEITFFSDILNCYATNIEETALLVEISRDKALFTPSTTSISHNNENAENNEDKSTHLRPDFICYYDQVPIIIGEAKASSDEMGKCKKQLENHTGALSNKFYGEIPFILYFGLAGQKLQFYVCMRRGRIL